MDWSPPNFEKALKNLWDIQSEGAGGPESRRILAFRSDNFGGGDYWVWPNRGDMAGSFPKVITTISLIPPDLLRCEAATLPSRDGGSCLLTCLWPSEWSEEAWLPRLRWKGHVVSLWLSWNALGNASHHASSLTPLTRIMLKRPHAGALVSLAKADLPATPAKIPDEWVKLSGPS